MTFVEWLESVPSEMRNDSLWKMEAYRIALFLADLGWHDVTKSAQDRRTVSLSDQLYDSLGSISANIAEGYSRGTGKDRARFYEYSLGSARESRDHDYRARHILGENVVKHRFGLPAQITKLLLVMVPDQRQRTIREEAEAYMAHTTLLEDPPF